MTAAELRMKKRYRSHFNKHGRCGVCQFRAMTAASYHCKGWPGRVSHWRFFATISSEIPGAPQASLV